ncbi:MAG TPA: glycosyltransferase [Terriglobia bacterium]|nr:glycosyltransferase [Terriglobia bacterium]
MKILWVKAGGLAPLDTGGKIRSYHILKELARNHEVTLFTFYAEQANDPHPELKTVFNRVEAIPLRLPPPKSFLEGIWYLRHLISTQPHSIAKFCRPEVKQRLRRVLAQEAADVILCDFLMPAPVIPWESSTPKVIFTHNVEAQIWQRHYQTAQNLIWKTVAWREYRTMERAERKYLSKADHVLTVSDLDRDFFCRYLDPLKVTVIPTGVDTEYFHPAPGSEHTDRLVFTGSMDWMPNEDGIVYFVQEILPIIRQQAPETTLCIVGRRPSERLKASVGKIHGVEITGRVEDIRPYVHTAAAYIVPLRVGGGTRLKIFEAMAMGKPVVSTTIGAEGLPVRDKKDILLADDPQKFAASALQLLRSPDLRSQIGLAGRALVESGYSWAAIGARFADVLERVVRGEATDLAGSERPEATAAATPEAPKI